MDMVIHDEQGIINTDVPDPTDPENLKRIRLRIIAARQGLSDEIVGLEDNIRVLQASITDRRRQHDELLKKLKGIIGMERAVEDAQLK